LVAALRDPHPQLRRHALRLAERQVAHPGADPALLAAMLDLTADPSPDVRSQLAFSLGAWPAERREAVAPALCELAWSDPQDPVMRTAIQSSLSGWADRFLIQWWVQSAGRTGADDWVPHLVRQIIAECDRDQLMNVLTTLMDGAGDRDPSLLGVAKPIWMAVQRRDDSISAPQREDTAQARQRIERLEAAALERARHAVDLLGGADPTQPPPLPVRDIERLAQVEPQRAVPLLLSWLGPQFPAEIQLASIRTLSQFRASEITQTYLEQWSSLSPRVRAVVGEALFSDPDSTQATLEAAVKGGIAASDLPLFRLQDLASRGTPPQRALAEQLLARAATSDRQAVVDHYRKSLQWPGDLPRGRQLFRQHCAGCHRVEGWGEPVGPELSSLAQKGADYLLTNILDPNLEVNPQFLNYVVLLHDGRTTSGMIVDESAASLTVQRADKERQSLLRSEIDQLRNTGRSLMPEGLEQSLSPQDMTDLLQYLMNVR
jgi:putative heme-binding domain-containing protein